MKKERITSIFNCVCALLLLATLVVQFLPFWTCTGCKTHKDVEQGVSIAEYLWLPKHHTTLTNDLTEVYRDLYGQDYKDPVTGKKLTFKADYILPSVLTVFIGSIVGMALCVTQRKKFLVAAIPLVVGIFGASGYMMYPALKLGSNPGLHVALLVAVAAVAGIALIFGSVCFFKEMLQKKKAAL